MRFQLSRSKKNPVEASRARTTQFFTSGRFRAFLQNTEKRISSFTICSRPKSQLSGKLDWRGLGVVTSGQNRAWSDSAIWNFVTFCTETVIEKVFSGWLDREGLFSVCITCHELYENHNRLGQKAHWRVAALQSDRFESKIDTFRALLLGTGMSLVPETLRMKWSHYPNKSSSSNINSKIFLIFHRRQSL